MAMGRLAGGLLILALACGSVLGASVRRPDLVVATLSVSVHGSLLRVTDRVRNDGSATAASSSVSYELGGTRAGGRRVRRLQPRETSRASTTVTVPRSVRPGLHRLRACADRPSRVRESNERNNCRVAAQVVRVRDRTPPTFAGLVRAATCIPGPIGGDRTGRYTLRWSSAADDVTPLRWIAYDVYQASESRGEDFSSPTYTAQAGATEFTTPPLPSAATYYFVVRARDEAGNRDLNSVERMGVNLCL